MRRLAVAAPVAALALALGAAGTGGADEGLVPPVLTPLPAVLEPPVTTPLPDPPDIGARLEAGALLRDAPGGRAVARVGPRTEFGSPRVLAVVRRRDGWLGVIASEMPNGSLGWVPSTRARLVREPVRLVVDLSARRLSVVRGRRDVWSMRVGVGSPGTPTPTGTFAVTDGLLWKGSAVYGCCVLALSGHQPQLAQGWTGGDRLAVHGTDAPGTIGAAASLGCLHATDADMRRLMRYATLGARVQIRA
jgi:lipoprotein-anchoring transpeptidase ErfK/SrfK